MHSIELSTSCSPHGRVVDPAQVRASTELTSTPYAYGTTAAPGPEHVAPIHRKSKDLEGVAGPSVDADINKKRSPRSPRLHNTSLAEASAATSTTAGKGEV